ncbi:glycosyltransferase [Modestobacter sp. VKM Ac-2983]|uniref:glycosyltransferase n=1 Tax=Modestobacter sp. VKM Ac-2983 TaxID=3004137 RepID=UPI0022AB7A92|nr:glycosyltransferase [Modestobacter sp. VKM Ac-2983]MCZ2806472.1 glycosyltransferase [Modestobacter sp. VKM Ac-2983]
MVNIPTTADAVQEALVEHAPPERLVAQRGLFGGPSRLVSDDMYSRAKSGRAHRERTRLRLEDNSHVTTNTYFGRFPASYWQRWTTHTEVRVTAQVSGAGRVSMRASDIEGDERSIAVADVKGTDALELVGRIDRFLDGGALWLEFETAGAELEVSDLVWTVAPPERLRPVAVVICTYNRADDCLNTLAAIADDPASLQTADAVYVVDQGTDRVDSRPGFAEIAATLGSRLVYINQPNLGGAGGFTRGLFEVAGMPGTEHANVIFMDDDVLCEPETVVRLNAMANSTAEPAIIGAQMLYLLHPDQLHVGAETADLPLLAAGIASPNALTAADAIENQQDIRVDAGYNGWWSCLIPAEIVAEVGLPLPLFFQWDDIEYGVRAREAGYATITLPGAGVWHADFGWKDWDDWHRYFNLRNAMVTAALHSDFDGRQVARGLAAQLGRYLLSMQYGLAHTLIKAVEDFCQGPAVLQDGGVAAAAEIRKERAAYGETVRHPAASMPGLRAADVSITPPGPPPSLSRLVLARRVVGQALGRTIKHPVAIPAAGASWYHVSRFETTVVTDSSQEGVRIRRRDPEAARELGIRGAKACYRLIRQAASLRAEYRAAMPQLTSRENWARLFDAS